MKKFKMQGTMGSIKRKVDRLNQIIETGDIGKTFEYLIQMQKDLDVPGLNEYINDFIKENKEAIRKNKVRPLHKHMYSGLNGINFDSM